MCKLFEKMVNARLQWYLKNRRLLSPTQFGFRKKLSMKDCQCILENEIQIAFNEGGHVLAISFDMEAAYDRAWKKSALLRLVEYGVRGERQYAQIRRSKISSPHRQ